MLILNLAKQRVQSQPARPERCSRCGGQTWQKWGGVRRRLLTDAQVKAIWTQRYRCSACGKTTTARPPGVGQAGRSQPFIAILGVFYALGLSHRSLEVALALLGYSVDHVTSWRDLQRLGRAVRRRLPAGRVRVVAVDETWLRVRGKARPAGLVVGPDGRMLGLELTGPGFDYRRWFRELAGQLGVEVVVTDDAVEYAGPIDDAGLRRQQCMVHMQRTLGRWKGRLKPGLQETWGDLLAQMSQLVRELPPDGAERLHHWARDPALPRELRRLAVHLQERWRQMTLHQREPEVPNTTNWLEGRFGRIKPRYKLTRGLNSAAGAANFMAVLGDVLK